jgi:hypothetical protein
MIKKLTVGAGIAALCLLGATGSHRTDLAAEVTSATLMSDTAGAVTTFTSGTSIISGNGDYQLLMEADGDLVENSLHGISPLVIYYGGDGDFFWGGGNNSAYGGNWTVTGTYVGEHVDTIWQSGTSGNPGARAVLQADGNFVIYSASNAVLWASNTAGHPGSSLSMQNDGNAVLYDNGTALWATKMVSVIDEHGSVLVKFRSCPGDIGDDCTILKYLPTGTGVTMLCWLSAPMAGAPSNKWFYSVLDGTQNSIGFVNAAYVDDQDKYTPACSSSAPATQLPPVPATPATTPPQTSSPGSGSAPAVTYTETVGGPTHTWTNYSNAGGAEGATIATHASVQVSCVVQGFRVADGNTNWYRIASSPWNNAYYASSDAFYNNGATSGSLDGTPYVDPKVPSC